MPAQDKIGGQAVVPFARTVDKLATGIASLWYSNVERPKVKGSLALA